LSSSYNPEATSHPPTEGTVPPPEGPNPGRNPESQAGFNRNIFWRFTSALMILAIASWWALRVQPPEGDPVPRNPLSLRFWVTPLEWHADLRQPYLTGTFTSAEVFADGEGGGWVYFGGQDGMVLRRELNGWKWDSLQLRPQPRPDLRPDRARAKTAAAE
jgi:hypothetical protein